MDRQPSEAQLRYYDDLTRLRGRRGLLMELLLDGLWHPNHELAQVAGLSFNDSIFALRREGWQIESRHKKGGTWEFRLIGKADRPTGHKAMSRPQAVVAGHYMHVITETLGPSAATQIDITLPHWMRAEPKAVESADERAVNVSQV
jgi:hypothetical protein